MGKAKATAVATLLAIAMGTCVADGAKKPPLSQKSHAKWVSEPHQFMGISVDGSESNLCHVFVPDSSPCLVMGALTNLPNIGFDVEGSALEFEQRVAYISLSFAHDDAARMAKLLIEKFGTPTAKRTGAITSVMGVRASDTQYEWQGENVDILFKEHDGNLSKGSVLVTSIPVWKAYQEDYAKRNGNPADNL